MKKKKFSTLQMGELFPFPSESTHPEISPDRPLDWEEREHALDVTRSWIVEAPAGSGKTGLLIQRYLKLLSLPGVTQPEQVLAITFTLKATGEIRERVLEQLERATEPDQANTDFEHETRRLALSVLECDQKFAWGITENPRRLNVRTIDSVCAEITRSLPILSGNGALSPVEDASSLYKLAAERTLMQLGGKDAALNKALRLVLLHRDGNISQVRDLLAEMLSLRDQWARLIPLGQELQEETFLDGPVLQQLEQTLEDTICIELRKLTRLFPASLLQNLTLLASELGNNEGIDNEPSPVRICNGIHSAPGALSSDLNRWKAFAYLLLTKKEWRSSFRRNHLHFEIDKTQSARLGEIIDQLKNNHELLEALKTVRELPSIQYPEEQWRVTKALFRILYRALAELQIVFSERGECDFVEPSLIARAALRNDGAAFETAIGMKLQHLLVDEMQDTSTSQYELIQLLTQGWDGRSQTVFFVGDPKQSIYLFRQARVEGFIQTMQQQSLGDLKLGALRLTANFRSQRKLIDAFNADFSRIFPPIVEEDRPEEVPYVAADPIRTSTEQTHGVVWHAQVVPSSSVEEKQNTRRQLMKREALEIRKAIELWLNRPLPQGRSTPWKIAVLVRNREHLSRIIAAFKQTPTVPFRSVGIEPLSDQPEILDLFALTRALLHPADRIAWLAVLRAPWCGLELAELHILTGGDNRLSTPKTIIDCIQNRSQHLSTEGCERLERIWPILRSALEQHSRLPLSVWIERTWRSLGADVPLNHEQRTNARQYFELLDQMEKQGAFSFIQLQSRLKSLYAESLAAPGAVDLMTIHGAKGLEWDVVFVPGLERKSRNNRNRLLAWNEIASSDQHTTRVLLAPITAKGEDSEVLNRWINRIQRTRELAEYKRIFYVASTRAREELHLFASPEQKQSGAILQNAGSLLHASWPAAEEHFVDIQIDSKPLVAPIISLRAPEENLTLPSLAAESIENKTSLLYRFPLSFAPSSRFSSMEKLSKLSHFPAAIPLFERPEGSFEARAFGNTVHTFLELLAQKFAAGLSSQELLNQISNWDTRISTVVRNYGLSPNAVEQLTIRVRHSLESTVLDPVGHWILNTHPEAFSEHALVSWQEERSSVRLDRIFRSGPEPLSSGNDYLWIIDYKTVQYLGNNPEEFFSHERETYAPQLQAYIQTLRPDIAPDKIRCGLYYPLLPGLTWWIPEPKSTVLEHDDEHQLHEPRK